MESVTDQDIEALPVRPEEKRRIRMTVSCRDCASIPKVPGAGQIFSESGGSVQLMHNGLKVVEGGYYGRWMAEIIRILRGHHEPQEEKAFHELLQYLPHNAVMIELGSFWAYYSLWFNQEIVNARNYMIEPDPNNLEIGRKNFALNGRSGFFMNASIGKASKEAIPFLCESDGMERQLPLVSIDDFILKEGIGYVDLILSDIQGFELDMLEGCVKCMEQNKLRFLMISTHHHSISNDPLTHQKCLNFLLEHGASILVEHNVAESYSGDGLIVASLRPEDRLLPKIEVSRNRSVTSLFRELEYDVAEAWERLKQLQQAHDRVLTRLNELESKKAGSWLPFPLNRVYQHLPEGVKVHLRALKRRLVNGRDRSKL